MSTRHFGESLPGPTGYGHFGFGVEEGVQTFQGYLQRRGIGEILSGEFVSRQNSIECQTGRA